MGPRSADSRGLSSTDTCDSARRSRRSCSGTRAEPKSHDALHAVIIARGAVHGVVRNPERPKSTGELEFSKEGACGIEDMPTRPTQKIGTIRRIDGHGV